MPFDALTATLSFEYEDVPPEWAPLVFPFDPDLPLFPLLYFHVLAQDLDGRRPQAQDRAFGYIRTVRIDIDTRVLTAEIVCNKDLRVPANRDRFLEAVRQEVGHRLGVIDQVSLDDVNGVFPVGSQFENTIPVLREIWHHVVGRRYGDRLPFGRLWDPVIGLARFYASGRRTELTMLHSFCTRFGERVALGANVPSIDFYLFPTWEELTDPRNPLALFPTFCDLIRAARDVCALRLFRGFDLTAWSYTGLQMPKGTRLNTAFYMRRIVERVEAHRVALVGCFNAFDKGPLRTVMFLMFLNDVRQIREDAPTPLGATRPRLNSSLLTAAAAADVFLNVRRYQSKEVLAIYAQQCHGNPQCFAIDMRVRGFLVHPMNVAECDSNRREIAELLTSGVFLGKVERLIWLAAQTRKTQSTVCGDALWCIKESAEQGRRGANPLACKACHRPIREVCPAYVSISNSMLSFNGSQRGAAFNLLTSAGDNVTPRQRLERCVRRDGLIDADTAKDWGLAFAGYPNPRHRNGEPLTVRDFVTLY